MRAHNKFTLCENEEKEKKRVKSCFFAIFSIFFRADDGTRSELWKSNGTEGGTVRVRDINDASGSSPSGLTDVNGILYFSADDGIVGAELMKSNGTSDGTILLRDIHAGTQ